MTADEGRKQSLESARQLAHSGARRYRSRKRESFRVTVGECPKPAGRPAELLVYRSCCVLRSHPNTNSLQPVCRLLEVFVVSIWKAFIAPFSLLWNYSNLFAPARNIIRQAEHWSDYVAAAIYIAAAIGFLIFLGSILSTQIMVTAIAVLGIIVIIKYAWYFLS